MPRDFVLALKNEHAEELETLLQEFRDRNPIRSMGAAGRKKLLRDLRRNPDLRGFLDSAKYYSPAQPPAFAELGFNPDNPQVVARWNALPKSEEKTQLRKLITAWPATPEAAAAYQRPTTRCDLAHEVLAHGLSQPFVEFFGPDVDESKLRPVPGKD